MNVKLLCALFAAGACCYFAIDCTVQADDGTGNGQTSTDQYNNEQKEYPSGNNQPTINEDEESGDTYVIPWHESDEYYGTPPPAVLDSKPQNPVPDSNRQDFKQLDQLPND